MKLDSRIKALSDVLTCFDTERARQFIGQKGYFSSDLRCFENLQSCKYGTLIAIICDKTEEGYAYLQDNKGYQDFFLPESSLKPVEKKYRPYTFEEFCNKFPVERLIKFREKGKESRELFLIQDDDLRNKQIANVYVCIGSFQYTFDELFKKYELYDYATGVWTLFGVEE